MQSPENSLRDTDALLGMVAHAGGGSRVLVEQLYEYKYWGPTSSNPITDPNPRLEAYIAAARRGAVGAVCCWIAPSTIRSIRAATRRHAPTSTRIAASEQINIQCLIGNPTGTGIHNKMVLVLAGGQGWVHTGSINGSENSVQAESRDGRAGAVAPGL